MSGWRGVAVRALLNPTSQRVIERFSAHRDQTVERHRLLRAMLLDDVRDGLPVTDRAAHLVATFGTAPDPYEDALGSYQRRPPDYLTIGAIHTLNAALGRPAPPPDAEEQPVFDWERRLDTLPLDQAIAELRALEPQVGELLDSQLGGLPAHLSGTAEQLNRVRQQLAAVATAVGPTSEASDRRLHSPVAQNLVLRYLQGQPVE